MICEGIIKRKLEYYVFVMTSSIEAKDLLGRYYASLLAKGDSGEFLSDGFLLSSCIDKPAKGKSAISGNMFFKLVKNLKVKSMIVEGDRACAIVNYTLVSPKGDSFSCDVAEVWEVSGGKLASMEMYYDTVAYQKFMIPMLFPLTRFKGKKRY